MVDIDGVGQKKVTELWKSSRLQLTQFMSQEDVSKFMNTYKLDFIDTQPDSQMKVKLRELLQDKEVKNDVVFSWIEDNIAKEERSSNAFIRTLTRVVTESQIDPKSMVLSEDNYADRCLILKRFLDVGIDGDTVREQQALFALQALMHELEHPNKLLGTIFFGLYNNDVISEEGFEAWLKSEDPAELEGKGVATKSTNTFFTWMKENENEDEDEEED